MVDLVKQEQQNGYQSASTLSIPEYTGEGSSSNPFVVEFSLKDPSDPMNFPSSRKWLITGIVTVSVFAITLTSSAYSGSSTDLLTTFDTTTEVFALGISFFVLGFAVGPALWAPLSELYGRRILFITTHAFVVAFVAASSGVHSMAALIVLRFLAGMFGASPLTNSGGVIADLFSQSSRGLTMALFGAAPFMGPVMGPILGGFVTETIGWRWVQGVCAIFIGVIWLMGWILIPETYRPVILRQKAERLSKETGKVYVSALELEKVHPSKVFAKALKRPWLLLFGEPIVFIASVYLSIIYGTIYMFLGAFSIVYRKNRHWSAGIGGLAFLGLAVGMLIGLIYVIIDNTRYRKLGKSATPEDRLPPGMIGAIALPIGMFAFAWTNGPEIHWSVSIILSAPFGFGTVLVFMACLNYLVDSYVIYAASVLAATAMLRSLFGFAFPLFTTQMYTNLGIHWASSVPAFLTVLCLPFPFVMYKYGASIRMKCKYAKEAAILLATIEGRRREENTDSEA